jgi:alanyl-tRNA synthetase
MKKILTVVGKTESDIPVMAGVFTLVGTHGVPLEIILSFFQQRGVLVDWQDYIRAALKDGHKYQTVRARILSAVGDVYGPVYRAEMEKRLTE